MVRQGMLSFQAAELVDTHFTDDAVGGAAGRVAGARAVSVG